MGFFCGLRGSFWRSGKAFKRKVREGIAKFAEKIWHCNRPFFTLLQLHP